MKPRSSNQRSHALTLVEVLLIVLLLAVLAAIILPGLAAAKRRSGIFCQNQIKQIGLAFQIWQADHDGKFPMEVLVASGGVMELAAVGNAVAIFQVVSNELGTPKILIYEKDRNKNFATNFNSGFSAKNISYFVGLDANKNLPQTFFSGDDNFAIGGVPVKSGLLELSTNSPITWTAERHKYQTKFYGNIGLVDALFVKSATDGELRNLLKQTGLATNRLAIP